MLLAWGLREAMRPAIGPTALPYTTFFPAVAGAAWYGGLGPALFSLALSTGIANYFYFEPRLLFAIHDPVQFVAFPLAAGIIIAAVQRMHLARAHLAHSRDVLGTTLASIGDGVIVTDAQGRVLFLNQEAERLTGWTHDDAQGRLLSEVFLILNETTRAHVENPVERVLKTGAVVGLANHTVLISKDGHETPIDDSAAPIREAGQPVLGVVLVFRDVREQRLAADTQARLAAIVSTSDEAILTKDLNGTVRSWNAAAERLFGYSADEIVGHSIFKLVPPDLTEEERTILAHLAQAQPTVRLATVRLAKGGRRIDVSITNSVLRDAEGAITGASTILHDWSETIAAQRALAREKELLETTLASIGDAVIATDADGHVSFLNPVASKLIGWNQEEAIGRPLLEVFQIRSADSRELVESPALRAMRAGAVVGLTNSTILVSREGREIPIDDSAAPIRDERRTIVGAVLVFRDVTERKRLEGELHTRLEQLAEVSQQKSEFLATLAHELRNPLAPIRNSIALLQRKGPQDAELVAARAVIDRQAQQMARLLDDLLDMNRLGRAKLELRRERVALADVVDNALETAEPAITGGGHRVSVLLPEEDVVLDADPVRLGQVFANLLTNAAKYMEPGGRITLQAQRSDSQVVVSVRDEGMGIEPEALQRIFEMFAQAPGAKERAKGGVGIGLSLAKGLVELHGGTIHAASAGPGTGSEFTVRLPVVAGPAARTQQVPPSLRSSVARRVLIADDVRDNADTLAMILGAHGHEVHAVYDGEQAVQAAERLRPEVVLLDIGMPGMDGYEVCRHIRAQAWGGPMFLIAQTGWGQESDRRRAQEAGFDQHLLKPVDCPKLLDLLIHLPRSPRDGAQS